MFQGKADVSARVRVLYKNILLVSRRFCSSSFLFVFDIYMVQHVSYLDPGHGEIAWLQLSRASWQGQPIASFETNLVKTLLSSSIVI